MKKPGKKEGKKLKGKKMPKGMMPKGKKCPDCGMDMSKCK